MTSSQWRCTSWWWNTLLKRTTRTGRRSSLVSVSSSHRKVTRLICSHRQKEFSLNRLSCSHLLSQNRQYWWSDGKFPKHAPHWLEGVSASAVRSAGDRGLCRCWCRGLSEASREEQEVLLNKRISKNSGDCRWKKNKNNVNFEQLCIIELLHWKEKWFESKEGDLWLQRNVSSCWSWFGSAEVNYTFSMRSTVIHFNFCVYPLYTWFSFIL